MTEPKLPEGAFVPSHGVGWLKPAKRFQPGNRAGIGNKSHADYRKPRTQQAAYALRKLFPALWDAMRAPPTTRKAWWRKRLATLLRSCDRQAADRQMVGILLLRFPEARMNSDTGMCVHCGHRLEGDALPLIVAALVSGWTHPRCHTAATQVIVMQARLALAQALEPHR